MPKVSPKTTVNIRSGASTDFAIEATARTGDTLIVQKKCADWIQLAREPVENSRGEVDRWIGGWVSLKHVCAPKSARDAARSAARTAADSGDQMLPAFRTMFRNSAWAQQDLAVPDC